MVSYPFDQNDDMNQDNPHRVLISKIEYTVRIIGMENAKTRNIFQYYI